MFSKKIFGLLVIGIFAAGMSIKAALWLGDKLSADGDALKTSSFLAETMDGSYMPPPPPPTGTYPYPYPSGTNTLPPPPSGTNTLPPPPSGTNTLPPPPSGTNTLPPPPSGTNTLPPPTNLNPDPSTSGSGTSGGTSGTPTQPKICNYNGKCEFGEDRMSCSADCTNTQLPPAGGTGYTPGTYVPGGYVPGGFGPGGNLNNPPQNNQQQSGTEFGVPPTEQKTEPKIDPNIDPRTNQNKPPQNTKKVQPQPKPNQKNQIRQIPPPTQVLPPPTNTPAPVAPPTQLPTDPNQKPGTIPLEPGKTLPVTPLPPDGQMLPPLTPGTDPNLPPNNLLPLPTDLNTLTPPAPGVEFLAPPPLPLSEKQLEQQRIKEEKLRKREEQKLERLQKRDFKTQKTVPLTPGLNSGTQIQIAPPAVVEMEQKRIEQDKKEHEEKVEQSRSKYEDILRNQKPQQFFDGTFQIDFTRFLDALPKAASDTTLTPPATPGELDLNPIPGESETPATTLTPGAPETPGLTELPPAEAAVQPDPKDFLSPEALLLLEGIDLVRLSPEEIQNEIKRRVAEGEKKILKEVEDNFKKKIEEKLASQVNTLGGEAAAAGNNVEQIFENFLNRESSETVLAEIKEQPLQEGETYTDRIREAQEQERTLISDEDILYRSKENRQKIDETRISEFREERGEFFQKPPDDSIQGVREKSEKVDPNLSRLTRQVDEEEKLPVMLRVEDLTVGQIEQVLGQEIELDNDFVGDYIPLDLSAAQINLLQSVQGVAKLEPDYKIKLLLDDSPVLIKSAQVRAKYGYAGNGIRVAVLDTGVSENHPGLAGKVVLSANFTDDPDATDLHGHGTHVACVIACNNTEFQGVAPGAVIMNGKVLNQAGEGSMSQLIAAIEWAVDNGADVINMSLGSQPIAACDGTDSLARTIEEAIDLGVLVAVAAGNDGPFQGTLTSPGCAESPITVGAVTDFNSVAYFSSRGPTADGRVKPDVVAPGVDIVSASNKDGSWVKMSGTSQATPHISGILALMAEAKPGISQYEAKQELMNTAIDVLADPNDQGKGLVDAEAAFEGILAGTAASEASETKPEEASEKPSAEESSMAEEDATLKASSDPAVQILNNLSYCMDNAGQEQEKRNRCFDQFIYEQLSLQRKSLTPEELDLYKDIAGILLDIDHELGEAYSTAALKDILGTYLYKEYSLDKIMLLLTDYLLDLENAALTEFESEQAILDIRDEVGAQKTSSRMDKYLDGNLDFVDVDDNQWFFLEVKIAKRFGCISGYKDTFGNLTGEFGPGNLVTVAEALKIALECAGHTAASAPGEPTNPAFRTHWAAPYINIGELLGLNIMQNLDNPDRGATRSEVLRMLLETDAGPPNEYKGLFTDLPRTHKDALWVEYAADLGIISGDAFKATVRPDDTINRAEMTKIVRQILKVFGVKPELR